MAKINNTGVYPVVTPADDDMVVGTDISTASDETVNFEIGAIVRREVAVNAQTGTTYTLVLADKGKLVTMSNASANTLTIPTNASVAYPVGTMIMVIQKGAGATTISGATGVTVNGVSAGSGAMDGQYTAVTLYKDATNTWFVFGAIGTVA